MQAKEEARAFFPTVPSLGDPRNFLRIDIPPQGRDDADATDADPDAPWFATLEALAAQATIITNPVLLGKDNGRAWRVRLDALVRRPEGTYMPVLISNHRVARPHPQKTIKVMATARLGLGTPTPPTSSSNTMPQIPMPWVWRHVRLIALGWGAVAPG